MLKFGVIIILSFFLFSSFFLANQVKAEEEVYLYFFYGDGCPHCAKEEIFLAKLEEENDNLKIFRYEVWHNQTNVQLLKKIGKKLNLDVAGVPILIIGDEPVIGYYSDSTTGEKIKSIINEHTLKGCTDIVGPIINNTDNQCIHGCDINDDNCIHQCGCEADLVSSSELPESITVPVFGELKVKNLSLPIFTIIIAAVDGFNPCAMWVLLFLISLLLGMKDRKRMWILGSAFVVASGAVYFLFLSAWLSLFLFLGFVFWLRLIIGLVALLSGGYSLRDFWRNREGTCKVTKDEKRKKIFARLKNITQEKSFWLALGGIILLAAAVNLVELVCSAGLPAVYTQVLALSNLARWQYYLYLFLYIIIFMLDDLFVFIIAMATLQMKAISSRYTRWSGLVGGIIMVIIGLLLLLKPGWLMLG
ncbi:MAG: hypothetical protein ABIG60_01395 [Patescibacteria group bacterium]